MPTDTPNAMLAWRECNAYVGSCLMAKTPFGIYWIDRVASGAFDVSFGDTVVGCHFPDLPSARAACEADYERRCREAGLVPAGDVGLSTSAAAALLLGLHREGALEQSGDEAAQVAIEEQGADLNAQPVVEAFLIVLAPTPAALADGTCVRCGAAPRNASGLCATCVDEDAVRAGELFAASAVSADAIRAEIARCEADKQHLTSMLGGAGVSDHEVAVLETWVAAYEEFAARLTALLPKPAGEGLPSPSPAGGAT